MRLLKKNIPLDNHKEIFYNLVAERNGKVEKLHNPVNSQNLMYHFVSWCIIDIETLFDDIKPKNRKIWSCRKNSNRIWIKI